MAADNTRKTSNVIHDLATLKTQVENNTNNIANTTSPKDGNISLSVGTGLALGDGSANASANQEANTQWTINLDPDNVNLSQYLKTVDGVGPNATTGNVDLKSSDDSLKVTPDTTNNTIDLTLNGTIPTVNDKTIGLTQGTGIGISGDNATTNMSANSNQTISLNASLSNLNDVDAAGATLNQALVYNGTQWLPGDVSGGGNGTVKTLDGVGPNTSTGDIDLSSPNGSLTITPDTANHTVKLELNGTIPTVNDGKINMTASNGVKMSSDSANASANQSGNTTFKIEADTDSLNSTLNFAKTTDIGNGSIGIIEGTGINVTGNNATANQSTNSNWTINLNASLSQLTDVSDTAAADKQVLTYNDTDKTWEPAASQTGGVTTLAALDDTNVSTPTDGQVLVWNGTDWENQNASGGGVSNLPISSTDDTVEVYQPILNEGTESEAPHTNHLAFRTGTNEKSLSVNGGNVGINKQYTRSHGVSQTALGDRNNYIGWSQQIEIPAAVTPDASGNSQLYGQRVTPLNIVPTNVDLILYDNGQIQTSNGVKSVSVFRVNDDDADAVSMKGFVGTVQERGLLERYNIDITGNAPSRFAGQIQTDTITTKDDASGDVITYLAGAELRVNTAIEKPDAPGTYARSNTLIVDQNSLQVMSSLNIGDDSLAPANIKIGYPSAVGSANTFGAVQWTCWDNSSNKEVIALAEVAMDATAGAGAGNEGELVFKTKKREVDGTTERLRITDNDIKAQDGYIPQSNDSLVTKGWVTDNTATGNYLPLAGGTMDAAADVIIPSGNSVNANLMVGGVVGDTIRDAFNIAARGTLQQLNAQVVSWAKPGGMAYLKLCTTDDISSYWNISGSSADENGTNYLRFSSEGQNWVTYSNATTAGDRKITHVPYTEFYGGIGTNTITTKDAASGDVNLSLGGQFMYIESGTDNVYAFNSSNHFVVGSKSSNVNANRSGIEIHDSSFPEMIFSMDADTSAADTVALRRSGSSFYINAQAVGDDVRIATGNAVRLTISDNDIAAFSGYQPQTDDSLVTKGWAAANTRLPAMGDDAGGNDFRVEYLDRSHDDEGVEEVDPANPSCVRLGVLGGLATAGVTRAGAFLVDGLGRLLASQSGYNSSQKPSRSQQFGLYSSTDIGNTRIGVALRGVHYGDVPEGTTQQGISYAYGFYSSPNFHDLKATTAVDFIAIGPSGSIDADTGESLTNGNCQMAVGFRVPSNFGTYIKHPLGGNPITQGFRSDLVVQEDKNQHAIFVNGTAPSWFNSPIQLTANAYLSDATDNSCQLYTAGGYWNLKQGPSGSPGGGVAFCFRFNDDRQTSNSWFKWSGKDADGNTQNGWFGYEQDSKRYRFLNETGAYSMYEVQVDSKDACFNVANGDTNMLKVSRANNTQTVTRSWTQIATASMPTDWVPSADHNLANKKYVDSRIWKGTQSEYDGLSEYDDDILYCITG